MYKIYARNFPSPHSTVFSRFSSLVCTIFTYTACERENGFPAEATFRVEKGEKHLIFLDWHHCVRHAFVQPMRIVHSLLLFCLLSVVRSTPVRCRVCVSSLVTAWLSTTQEDETRPMTFACDNKLMKYIRAHLVFPFFPLFFILQW